MSKRAASVAADIARVFVSRCDGAAETISELVSDYMSTVGDDVCRTAARLTLPSLSSLSLPVVASRLHPRHLLQLQQLGQPRQTSTGNEIENRAVVARSVVANSSTDCHPVVSESPSVCVRVQSDA